MNTVNPNNNKQKRNDILELWYRLTGETFGKVNLAANMDLKKATPAATKEYIDLINKKDIPLTWNQDIVVKNNQNIHISFFHDFNLYDMQNPQKGVEDRTSFKAIKYALYNKNPKDYNLAIFSGDIVGKEFNIGTLNNASIENKKIMFWGLKKRMEKFIDYLFYVAENGADEIILMNGRDEHVANKMLNRDLLRDALLDKFNNVLLKYAVEKVNAKMKKKSRKVKISYVSGVKKVFNICKQSKDKNLYYDFSVHTNLRSNSTTMQGNFNAAKKQHGQLAEADLIFVPSENVVGNYANVIFASGLARYKNTSRNYVPELSAKGYNSFDLILGDQEHEIEALRSTIFTNPKTHQLEKYIAIQGYKVDYIKNLCLQKINELSEKFYSKDINHKKIYDEINSKGE